ncbi:MAG TPA: hypothetical protein VN908_05310 [Gemmatimonadales bacterium]|nr:hypothetical protein [Gemmatimonadales bacterium]
MPRNNMFKIGVATAAAAVGAILAITSVFAHSAPSTGGISLVGSIVGAASDSSIPDMDFTASNQIIAEQEQDAAEAAALAAKIAAEQQKEAAELAAKQAALAAKQAAEAAEPAETDEDAAETETADVETDTETPATTAVKTVKTVKTEHGD